MDELSKELHFSCIRSLQRTGSLLDLHPKVRGSSKDQAHLDTALASVASALQLLFEVTRTKESLRSVIDLMLKAELALAMLGPEYADLSVRVAESVLQETRVRLETHARGASPDALARMRNAFQDPAYEATVELPPPPRVQR